MLYDVLVSGMNVVDILTEIPTLIKTGEKHEVSNIMIQGGAPAGNAASSLAKSQLKTAFLGYKSNSTLSMIAEQELKRCKVDTSLLIEKKNHDPAIAIVEIDSKNGDRTVYYSTSNYTPLQPSDIDESWLKNSRLLFVDGYDIDGNIHLLKLAKKLNVPSVLDIEAGDISKLKEMISLGTHIILPFEGAKLLTGKSSSEDCFTELQKLTNGQLIITDGANGSWAINENNQIIHQKAYKTKVVDTTGCGDAFHAAYAMALLNGDNLEKRMEYASAYASRVAMHFGGRSYFPTKNEVNQVILNN
jgi:sulfofructose kinase